MWLRGIGEYCLIPDVSEAMLNGLMMAANENDTYYAGIETEGMVCHKGVATHTPILILAKSVDDGIRVHAQTLPDEICCSHPHVFPYLLEDARRFIRKRYTQDLDALLVGELTWQRLWEVLEWLQWSPEWDSMPHRCIFTPESIGCAGRKALKRIGGLS